MAGRAPAWRRFVAAEYEAYLKRRRHALQLTQHDFAGALAPRIADDARSCSRLSGAVTRGFTPDSMTMTSAPGPSRPTRSRAPRLAPANRVCETSRAFIDAEVSSTTTTFCTPWPMNVTTGRARCSTGQFISSIFRWRMNIVKMCTYDTSCSILPVVRSDHVGRGGGTRGSESSAAVCRSHGDPARPGGADLGNGGAGREAPYPHR